jgi:hypothetical protein
MLKLKIKAFMHGFDYAVKNYDKIEDRHFHTLPGASWHDNSTQRVYRKSIAFGRKYMQYRYEILALAVIVFTTLLFMFTW